MSDVDSGKWEIDDGGRAVDDNGEYVFRGCIRLNFSVRETTEQIVREHNAHEELLALGYMYKERLEVMQLMGQGHYAGLVEKIDAVLAQAEGRE